MMRRALMPLMRIRSAGSRRLILGALAGLAAAGCGGKKAPVETKSVATPPTVSVVAPAVRKITRVVGQPSFVEAYEQTPIYPKVTAYIEKWIVDIGDKVKKGEVLATLFVPEMRQDFESKKADVLVAKARIDLRLKKVDVASAEVKAANARVSEAVSTLDKYKADVARWDSEVKRLTREKEGGVIDPQVLGESTRQLESYKAMYEAQGSKVLATKAELLAREADLAEANADVTVARASLTFAESEAKRLEAWVGYLTLTAPYDGIIVARNANTGDFVLPASGDPSADRQAPDISAAKAAPIYVIARTDVVRVFVDVPEQDANYVKVGTRATVMVKAFRDKLIDGKVTRTAWALNTKSRTLRVEIDLPNTDAQILPGMYAYGKVIIERPEVRAIPQGALAYIGDEVYCWQYEGGKARLTEIQIGVSNGESVEVTNRRVPSSKESPKEEQWVPFDGSEKVIVGDLSILTDGGPVNVDEATSQTKVAGAGLLHKAD
ncbi:efflux RND transporter periplasmic adaptor subunit [Singulisphaera sp. PoT]|uniref:efflux RND transporter periplasmic adaptor subunit n=1 Tax=Singulisphaera sp. PoT TaxID=3411797 RepID=UPI003BF59EB6